MTAEDAAKRLVDWMKDENVDMGKRVKIAQDMLDRGGLTAVQKHLARVGPVNPVESPFRNILSDPNALVGPKAEPLPPSAELLEWNHTADPDERP